MKNPKITTVQELKDPEGKKLGNIAITVTTNGNVFLSVEADPDQTLKLYSNVFIGKTAHFTFTPKA